MRLLLIGSLVTAMNCIAQEPAMQAQSAAPPIQLPPPAETEKQPITVPAGTRVPLTLTNPMRAKRPIREIPCAR